MPIIQIPFQDPVAPPEKPGPEQLGLYDTQDWETAYRDLDARVPHLLIQLQDDLERSRWREAVWLSIIVHLVLGIVLWQLPLIEKTIGWHTAVVVPVNLAKDKNLTFLALPPDLQKAPRKPKTNIASDKDRIAMSRHPELNRNEKTLVTPPAGRPGPAGTRSAQPAQPAPAMPQSQAPPQQQPAQQRPTQRPQFQNDQTAQLQAPAKPNVFSKYNENQSAGSAIQQ